MRYLIALLLATGCFAHPLENRAITSEYISTPQGKLYIEKEGSGPVLILVAGGPGSNHFNFHQFVAPLASRFTLVYLDNLGRGKSDRLPEGKPYTVEQDADDIEAVRKHLGVQKVALIGHSYGGMPVLEFALRYPQHASKAVICSSPGSGPMWQASNIASQQFMAAQYPETWQAITALRKQGTDDARKQIGALLGSLPDRSWYSSEARKQRISSSDPTDKASNAVFASFAGKDGDFILGGTLASYDPFGRTAALQADVFLCAGRHDYSVPPSAAFEIQSRLPAGKSTVYVFERSGHRPWSEETPLYIDKVSTFLTQ